MCAGVLKKPQELVPDPVEEIRGRKTTFRRNFGERRSAGVDHQPNQCITVFWRCDRRDLVEKRCQ